jgi:glycine C-acetyltransferase
MTDTYKHANMQHLEQKLEEHQDKNACLIVTDGVFSMDGDLAPLDHICSLADKYDAMVFVDDSHATGFIGKTGRGTHEHFGVLGNIDVITTTLGKALGGASGGCVSGRKELVELCRQRARPYLFSNTMAPPLVAGGLKVLEILSRSTERRDKLEENSKFWRRGLTEAGFVIKEGESPIVPVMLFNAKLSQDFARDLYDEGVYVIGFFFPVVPNGQARIRTQLSADHEIPMLEQALAAFKKVGAKYLFLPDEYLAKNVARDTGKHIIFPTHTPHGQSSTELDYQLIGWHGKCEVHEKFTVEDIAAVRQQFPDVVILSHPECSPEVVDASDFSGSTSAMIKYVEQTSAPRYLMLTECAMGDNVAASNPDKEMLGLCSVRCPHMNEITLEDTLYSLRYNQYVIEVPEDIRVRAAQAVERMIAIG